MKHIIVLNEDQVFNFEEIVRQGAEHFGLCGLFVRDREDVRWAIDFLHEDKIWPRRYIMAFHDAEDAMLFTMIWG